MAPSQYLLHPELINDIPFASSFTGYVLNKRVSETLRDDPAQDSEISIVIRTLNEAIELEKLLHDIHSQLFKNNVEVIVVDNKSSDKTSQVARHYGAEVVTIARDNFSYPKSMNEGMEAASHELVFLTVGHARLSSMHNLHAGARHFRAGSATGGAFGGMLPGENASDTEKLVAIGMSLWLSKPAHTIKRAGLGTLGATGAMISRQAWEELGRFDERYESGGEDTALAKLMFNRGFDVVKEPALTVHHSHGLGAVNYAKQFIHWQKTLRAPQRLDKEQLFSRRPDLKSDCA